MITRNLLLWNSQKYLPELAQISLSLSDTPFEDPVLLNPLDGSVYEFEDFQQQSSGTQFFSLPQGDFPMTIIEKVEVTL